MATTPPPPPKRSSTSQDRKTRQLLGIGLSCLLISFIGLVIWIILSLFVTRMPFWVPGLSTVLFGVGLICWGLGTFTASDGSNVAAVMLFLPGLAFLVLGLSVSFGIFSLSPLLLNSLKENDVAINVGVQPETVTPSMQANLSLTIHNRDMGTLDLSTIELRTPQEFWSCFVVDYAAAEPSIVAAGLEESRIEFEGVTLDAGETLLIEVPLIGNRPGDCSGSYTVFAKATLRGRSYAKIDDTTLLTLAVMP